MVQILDEPKLKKLTGYVSSDEEVNADLPAKETERIRNW